MREHHHQVRPWSRRFAGAGSFAALAVLVASTGVAHADDGVSLPDGQKAAAGVTISRTGETANVLPSLASNESRSVYVSGNVNADVTRDIPPGCLPVFPLNFPCPNNEPLTPPSPGTNNSQSHFSSQLNTGYIIGCQVSVSNSAISLAVSASISLTNFGGGSSVGVQIGPGEVKFVQINFKDIVKPGHYAIEYRGINININGCGGRAQARAYTVVEIIGDAYAKYSLYGEPFDIP